MMKPNWVRVSLLGLLVCLSCPSGAAIVSTFDADAEGWLVVQVQSGYGLPVTGGVAANWSATYGLLGGGIETTDQYAETFFSAPAKFLGNQSFAFGTDLQFDIYISYTDNAIYPAVILHGTTKNLYYNILTTPINAWTHRAIPLAGSGWRIGSYNGAAATDADMLEVLSDLRGLYINAEWKSGPDLTYLDDVILNGAAPACGDAQHPYPVADLNHDCRVNWLDAAMLAAQWARADCTPDNGHCDGADFDVNTTVDLPDLMVIANQWLQCTDVMCP
jgi:hypothetical protein